MQPRTNAPSGYSACRISLIDRGQLLRQLTSCIRIASPYLYPAKDNHRLGGCTSCHITRYGEYPHSSPYIAQTISTLVCKMEKPWENHMPSHFPNAHHCRGTDVLTIPPLRLLDQFNQSKHQLPPGEHPLKKFSLPTVLSLPSQRAKAKRHKYTRGHILV
jgi:hypothetical protein